MNKQVNQRVRHWAWLLGCPLILASCSNLLPAQQTGDATLEQARLYAARGQDDEAIQLLQPLVEAYPRQPQYKNWLTLLQEKKLQKQVQQADSMLAAQQYDAAAEGYQQVLQTAPNNRAASDGLQKVQLARQHAAQIAQVKTAMLAEDWAGAEFGLRSILAEQPAHAEARQLFEQLEQKKNERSSVVRPLQSALKKQVTLELKNTPIKHAFEYLGKAGGLNFSFDQELNEGIRVNVLLRDTPIEQALDVILTSHQLGKKVLNSNTLLIYPQARAAQYEELFVRSFYLTHIDAKRALNMMKTVLRASDVYMDEKLNTLVIRDTMDRIKVAEKLIASQDLNEPEVMLEVEVLEVKRTRLQELGLIWPTQLMLTPLPSKPGGTVTLKDLLNLNSSTLGAAIPSFGVIARGEDGNTNVLANPRIRTRNREVAKILIGDRVPNITTTSTSTGFVAESVQYIDIGLKLDVQPTIYLDNEIAIRIALEVSNIVSVVQTKSGTQAYQIGTRNASTVLRLKDGENQVLAGLISDEERSSGSGLPGLSKLPVIGRLFGTQRDEGQKTELVLSITPRLVRNNKRPALEQTEFSIGPESAMRPATLDMTQFTEVVPPPVPTSMPAGGNP